MCLKSGVHEETFLAILLYFTQKSLFAIEICSIFFDSLSEIDDLIYNIKFSAQKR